MKKFIERALERLPKLDYGRIRSLIQDVVSENELLEIVLESMTDGVVVLDSNHSIILKNRSADILLPFSTGDTQEKRIWQVLSDREIGGFFRNSLENQERISDKQFTLGDSGGLRILSCSIMPLVKNGGILGNLIHIEDVTERRGKEARLRRAESLAALTTLAAGVAHEIKNPLGSIGIHIQLIQKEISTEKKPDKETIGKYLDIVMEEVERLNGIVVDFLFAVRPMNTDLVRKDLNQLVQDTIEFVKFEVSDANVGIEENYTKRMPDLDLDEKYIKQALLNIIKNAISAMPEGGTLSVDTVIDGSDVLLKIGDTGVGIAEENIAKVFEPYFTTKEFGSGLGLTVVYKIIREHGGEVSLTSIEGKGTNFTLSFPIPESERRLIVWEEQDK